MTQAEINKTNILAAILQIATTSLGNNEITYYKETINGNAVKIEKTFDDASQLEIRIIPI